MVGSHVVLGVAAWVVAAPHLGMSKMAYAIAPVALAIAGSLLPDIDHPKSWIGRRLKPVSVPIAFVFGHRGFTHSILAVAACVWFLFWGGQHQETVAPLVVGYASHLAADLLTPNGLRLAWPLRKSFAVPICKSGSAMEPVVVALILAWVFVKHLHGTLPFLPS